MINELLLRVEYQGSTYDLIVDNEVPLRIDMSAVESQDFGKFFGIGSQTFSLPGTKETNRFFNYAYDVSTDDVPAFYNTLDCSVVLNGETVLIGSLQLIQVVTNDEGYVTYEVQVIDKVLQFEQALASQLVAEADWSAYDHILSSGSIIDSWSDNLLSGSVYYPLVHYGYPNGERGSYPQLAISPTSGSVQGSYINNRFTPLQVGQLLPAIRLKDTMDVIFNQAGFTYTGSFTETDDFNNLYILNKPNEGLGVVASGSDQPTFFATTDSNVNNIEMATVESYNRVQFANVTTDPSNSYTPVCNEVDGGITESSGSKYTAPGSGQYSFYANVAGFNPLSSTPGVEGVLKVDMLKGTVGCDGTSAGSGTQIASNEITLNQAYGFNVVGLSLTANDVDLIAGQDVFLRIAWYATSGTPTAPSNNFNVIGVSSYFQCTSGPVSYEGSTVDMSLQWQPATKSIDIIRGLLQQFNLVMTPNPGNRSVIVIETFDDWIRAGEIKDWTDKYDTAKRISINHTVDNLEREILLKSADDADRFSRNTLESAPNYQYGTLRLLSENNIPQGEKTVGDYFAPVVLGGATGYLTTLPGIETTQIDLTTNFIYPHLYKFENSKLTSYTTRPRIGYKVEQSLTGTQEIYIGISEDYSVVSGSYSTIGNVAALPVTSTTNDLHFNNTYTLFTGTGVNLNGGKNNFNNYWKTYYDSLYWEGAKVVTLDLFFNEYEYKDIQLNDRILIKGQAYRINKISGFNVSHRDVVTVELIKLYPAYWQL